jgi:hypothetical protein
MRSLLKREVANVSLAYELTMDGVLHFQGFVDLLLLPAHAQVFDEKVANVSLAFELTMYGVFHFQEFCSPFY